MTTTKKIILLVAGAGVLGIGAWLLLRKKTAATVNPDGSVTGGAIADTSTVGTSTMGDPNGWSKTRTELNPVKVWGYSLDASGARIVGPRIRVTDPAGKQYGSVYLGGPDGTFELYIPTSEYGLEIFTADGSKSIKGPAYQLIGQQNVLK